MIYFEKKETAAYHLNLSSTISPDTERTDVVTQNFSVIPSAMGKPPSSMETLHVYMKSWKCKSELGL